MLDRILRFSIDHRFLVVMLGLGAAGMSVISLLQLPIDAVPDITNNQVQINTVYSALSPEEVEKQITFPIETALSGIPGMQFTRSLSRNGFSQVQAVFEDHVDIYFARNQITERLTAIGDELPPGAEPQLGPIATGLGEVYSWTVEFAHPGGQGAETHEGTPGWQPDGTYITSEGERLSSEVEQLAYLRTIQDWVVRPQMKTVPGVADIDVIGGYEKQYHVQPDPGALIAHGLTFSDLIEALERNNNSVGAGFIEYNGEMYLVRAPGRVRGVEQIGGILLRTIDGAPLRVRDVAEVGVGPELRTGSASVNGREVVIGTAMMLIGGNSRVVAQDVHSQLEKVRKSLPPDVVAETVYNRTKLVDATVLTVEHNLIEGAILVIVVLFLLLGNIRAAIITSLAIPLSMLLAATGMMQAKVSGNLMSLGAIDFGLIVDGAVIIVENSIRRLAERQKTLGRLLIKEERLSEVHAAAAEVIKPSAFGQAIIIIVYVPLLALTGVEGKMFHPMAITVILALLGAFVLSITMIPALVSIFLSRRIGERENPLIRGAKWMYEPTVRWALKLRYLVVVGAVAAFVGSAALFSTLGQEFVPTLDEHDLAIEGSRIISTGIRQSQAMEFGVETTLSRFPQVQAVFSKTGTAELATDAMPPSSSDTIIVLKPRDKWPDPVLPQSELIEQMEEALSELPGNGYEFSQPIELRFNELIAGVKSDIAVKVFGDEFDQMIPTATAIARVLAEVPGAQDVKVEQTQGLPVLDVRVDRDLAARYGLNVADVQDVVAAAIGGREAGVVFEGDRRFNLIVRLPERLRGRIETLPELPIPLPRTERHAGTDEGGFESVLARSSAGDRPGFVPLRAVANVDIAEGPFQVSRENGKRRIVVQCNVRGRDIGSFVAEAQDRIDRQVKVHAAGWLEWGGQFEHLESARQRLLIVVPICFFLIFLLLFSTLDSVKQALIVFTGVPLGLTGGVVALWLRDMPFSISAGVGFIALSGIAVLNGLVMITFINELRREGLGIDEAVTRGSLTRLRPVLMTALVASLGFLPMALATSTGAEVQRPLATVVIGGLISSTLLTLVVLPSLYRMVERQTS